MLTIKYSQSSPTPWLNGKGQTTELISWERSRTLSAAPAPAWRLSIARLEGAAAFSPIPQVHRHFLPVGTSVLLRVNGSPRRVNDRTITQFAGADVVDMLRLDPCPGHAVNLMIRTSPSPGSITFGIGSTADESFRTCLVAVALEPAPGIGLFDVVTPASPEVGVRRVLDRRHSCDPSRLTPRFISRAFISPSRSGTLRKQFLLRRNPEDY